MLYCPWCGYEPGRKHRWQALWHIAWVAAAAFTALLGFIAWLQGRSL
jgi:hypothetical protein